jgi:hypothetical protein
MKTRLLMQLITNEGADPIQTGTKPPLRNHTELLGKYQFLHRLLLHVNTGEDINEEIAGSLSQLLLRISQLPQTGKKICFKTETNKFRKLPKLKRSFVPSSSCH